MKVVIGMEVGLSPGDFVLDGDPAPLPKKEAEPPPQFFGPCLLWPNGRVDQDDTSHGGGPWSRLDGDPDPLPQKGAEPPIFGSFLLWPNGWMHQDAMVWR